MSRVRVRCSSGLNRAECSVKWNVGSFCEQMRKFFRKFPSQSRQVKVGHTTRGIVELWREPSPHNGFIGPDRAHILASGTS